MEPTRVRWRIAGLLLAVTSLTYVDRLNMSVAAGPIQTEFGLTNVEVGVLLSAFVLGYALFQVPGGALVDLLGPTRVMLFAMGWWSIFTIATAFAPALPWVPWLGAYGSLLVIRFAVGVGEAPAMPSASKLVGLWMPLSERGLGNAIFIAGMGLGGIIAPPLIVFVMQAWGWRAAFIVSGLVGLPLMVIWGMFVTNRPAEHPRVNQAEAALTAGSGPAATVALSAIPWRALLSNRSVLALIIGYFLAGYTAYLFFTWYFLYIVQVRQLTLTNASLWAMAPFAAMAVASLVGGAVADQSVRRYGLRWGRRIPVFGGMSAAGVLLLSGALTTDARLSLTLMALAAGASYFALVNWWAATVELGRDAAGSLGGLMNAAGNLGGVISPTLTPYLAERIGWPGALSIAAACLLLAGAAWMFIAADRPVRN